MFDGDPGIEGLMASLAAIGAESVMTLPAVDDPLRASTYVRRVLELTQARGIAFESAWSSAINRIQAPQGDGGLIEDPALGQLVLEERALLEEARPIWQAAYERRAPEHSDRRAHDLAALRRIDPPVSAALDRLDARFAASAGRARPTGNLAA